MGHRTGDERWSGRGRSGRRRSGSGAGAAAPAAPGPRTPPPQFLAEREARGLAGSTADRVAGGEFVRRAAAAAAGRRAAQRPVEAVAVVRASPGTRRRARRSRGRPPSRAPRRAVCPADVRGRSRPGAVRGRPAAVAAAEPGSARRRPVVGAAAALRGLPDDQGTGGDPRPAAARHHGCRARHRSARPVLPAVDPRPVRRDRWRAGSRQRVAGAQYGHRVGRPVADRPARPDAARSTSSSRATRCRRSRSASTSRSTS